MTTGTGCFALMHMRLTVSTSSVTFPSPCSSPWIYLLLLLLCLTSIVIRNSLLQTHTQANGFSEFISLLKNIYVHLPYLMYNQNRDYSLFIFYRAFYFPSSGFIFYRRSTTNIAMRILLIPVLRCCIQTTLLTRIFFVSSMRSGLGKYPLGSY